MQTWPCVLPSRIERVRINKADLLIFLFLIPYKELSRISRAERSMGNQLDATYFIILFNAHSMLNMFRPLIRPSSGVCD